MVNLVDRSLDVLTQLGASIETTAQNAREAKPSVSPKSVPVVPSSVVPKQPDVPSIPPPIDTNLSSSNTTSQTIPAVTVTSATVASSSTSTSAPKDLDLTDLDDDEIANMMQDSPPYVQKEASEEPSSDLDSYPRPHTGGKSYSGKSLGKSIALAQRPNTGGKSLPASSWS
ncbi:hypothetical protein HDU99_008696, partial [Rhizoclosmatium hyalinum]